MTEKKKKMLLNIEFEPQRLHKYRIVIYILNKSHLSKWGESNAGKEYSKLVARTNGLVRSTNICGKISKPISTKKARYYNFF